MQRPVQAERRAAEDSRQHFISAANLAEGLQAASSEKTAITEFYLTEGRFPRSNAEVGMLAPEKYTGRSLRSVTLAKNGVMTLAYEDKTGKGTIRLIPEDSNQQGRVTWRCVTASYANIATILPSCEYTNSAGTSGASSTRN
jgi:type IV pilus assembly protein PilA